jgi:hypothetical protein
MNNQKNLGDLYSINILGMKVKFIFLITPLFIIPQLFAMDKMGDIKIQINDGVPRYYIIKQAFIYQDASIAYDSSVIIQNEETLQVLFFPQLSMGENNLLRLVFGDIDGDHSDFFDYYFLLGDSLSDTLFWQNDIDKIFMTYNGRPHNFIAISKGINGQITFNRNKSGEFTSGAINVKYSVPSSASAKKFNRFGLDGAFSLIVGDYHKLTLESNYDKAKKKRAIRKNIIIGTIVVIFVAGVFIFK